MKVGFIGLGKLGRDAAEVLNEQHDVTGYDPNVNVPGLSGTLQEACTDKDIVLIAVQTPHDPAYDGKEPTSHLPPKDFDYSFIRTAVQDVDNLVDENTLIVVISTMLPGTVRREIAPLIKNGRFIYNPYLIAQGTVKWDMRNPEMIMIGTEEGEASDDADLLYDLYDPILDKICRYEIGTWEEIEALKVFYNTFISTKLALVNMIQDVAENVGHMNVDVVTNALKNSTQRIMGPSYMKAGFGDGGGCHPRDNIALRVLNDRYQMGYDLFDAIMKAREEQAANMARYCLKYNMPVVILGKAFKPGIDQTAGSPSMLVGWYIEKLGSQKVYYDKIPDGGAYTILIHDKGMIPETWDNPGSCIIDPYRELEPVKNHTVKHYGNSNR
jgi:UDPglucose 6-dehydrogenase